MGNLQFEIHDSNSPTQWYYWRIMNGASEMAKSETLVSKEHAKVMAEFLKKSASALTFEVVRLNNTGWPYGWRVKDGNHKIIIASSRQFSTQAQAQGAADTVKLYAWSAEIVDMTRTGARR